MKLNFREAACVVRGSFNIHIFQPGFISSQISSKLIENLELTSDFSKPGFQVRCPEPNVVWTVRPDGVVISSESQDVKCGDMVASVLKLLPLTPIIAVGNNFVFGASVQDDEKVLCDPLQNWFDFCGVIPDFENASAICTLQREGCSYSIEILLKEDEILSRVNSHRSVASAEEGIAAANSFEDDLETARSILSNLFQIEVGINE